MTPFLAKVIIVTCSRSHDVLWAELGGTENENLRQLTRRIDKELHVTKDNVEEQKLVVETMRAAMTRLCDPANWDGPDPIFGQWKKGDPVVHPLFQKRIAPEGSSSSSGPEPKRHKPDEEQAPNGSEPQPTETA
jgi:hypothetical protein